MNLLKDIFQAFRDIPCGKMRFHFLQVADVANVIAFPILVYIFVQHLLARNGFDHIEGFKYGAAISATST